MSKVKTKKSFEDIFIDMVSYGFILLISIVALLPFVNIVSKAFSADWAVVSGKVSFWPVDFQLDSFKSVLNTDMFQTSFLNSIFITVVGTCLAMFMTVLAAYPLSKKHLPGIKPILLIYVFTILFHGGLIPTYLLMSKLHLLNKMAVLILPGILSVFNMLVVKSYFESLPESLEEAAKIDGASNIRILFTIVLPLSKPVIATVSLFYAVGYWNSFFSALMYVNKQSLKPLQLYLYDLITQANGNQDNVADPTAVFSSESVRATTIVASTIPMLLLYPFLQKYFIKGVLIGSVKG